MLAQQADARANAPPDEVPFEPASSDDRTEPPGAEEPGPALPQADPISTTTGEAVPPPARDPWFDSPSLSIPPPQRGNRPDWPAWSKLFFDKTRIASDGTDLAMLIGHNAQYIEQFKAAMGPMETGAFDGAIEQLYRKLP